MDAQYRPIYDSDSYGRGVLKLGADLQCMSNQELIRMVGGSDHIALDAHDHMPENDAGVIYLLHLQALKFNSQ